MDRFLFPDFSKYFLGFSRLLTWEKDSDGQESIVETIGKRSSLRLSDIRQLFLIVDPFCLGNDLTCLFRDILVEIKKTGNRMGEI